jgi:hypothetical protein
MSNKVIADVDVFGPRVKVVGRGECECRLVVAIEGGRCDDNVVEFADKAL